MAASGHWVMLITSAPARRYPRDSARVANRGPLITTTVPPSRTSSPSAVAAAKGGGADARGVGVGEGDVLRTVVELVVDRAGAALGAVDQLVGDDERTRAEVRVERAAGERRDDRVHSHRAQRPEVGSVVDPVRGQAVIGAVPGEERDRRCRRSRPARWARTAVPRACRPRRCRSPVPARRSPIRRSPRPRPARHVPSAQHGDQPSA